MFENPFLSGKGIYFSESRSLSAHHGEWLTFDPMLKWNPENLLSSPTDMNGFRYVNGDPVNFVDPSGRVSLPAVLLGVGIGGTASGIAAYNSGARDWDLARAIIIGAGSGALAGTGLGGVFGGMGIGGATNAVSQISQGKNLDTFNVSSFAISTLAGGAGTGFGNLITRNFRSLPMNIIGMNLEGGLGNAVQTFNSFSNSIISTGTSGLVGGGIDFFGHELQRSFEFNGSTGVEIDLGIFSGPNPYTD